MIATVAPSLETRRRMVAWAAAALPPRLFRLALVLALSLAAAAAALAQPWLTKDLIDHALPERRLDAVIRLCGLLFGLSVLSQGLGLVNRLVYVRVSAEILFALRQSLFAHLMTLSPRWFARAREGDLFSRLDGDVSEVQRFVLDGALATVNALVLLVGATVAMASLSPPLTLLSVVVLPLQVAVVAGLRPRVEVLSRALRGRAADLGAFFFETLPAAAQIQALQAQERETARLGRLNQVYLNDLLRLEKVGYAAQALPALMMSAATALIFVYGAANLLDQAMTIGAMVAFTAYLGRAAAPLQSLLGLWVASRRARVSLDRLGELMGQRPEAGEPADPLALPSPVRGEISARRLTLRHDGKTVFENLDFTLPAGARIAVVGPSGAGKSSLCALLLRLYDPDGGDLALDGVPLARLRLNDLRRAVAVVPQDVVLMPGSIADNVAYGCPSASQARIRDALAAAGLADFVDSLPDGAASAIGSHGRLLSGGQRQRLAIARAVLMDPAVLVLDEVTTGLEPRLRHEVLDSIDRLFAGRTRLVISHDEMVTAGCDLVLRLPDGRLGPP